MGVEHPEDLSERQIRVALLRIGGRMLLAAGVLLTAYWLIPLEWFDEGWSAFAVLVVGLGVYLFLVVRRMLRLRDSPQPMADLGEALVIVVVTLVTLFALTYAILSRNIEGAFNVPLDKHSALYFSMTVTTTTGFGDIVATANNVRDVVTFQMFITLLILALAVRGVTAAAQYGRQRNASGAAGSGAAPGGAAGGGGAAAGGAAGGGGEPNNSGP